MTDDRSKSTESLVNDKAWEELVKNMLRAEMMRRGVSYAALADRLAEFGITDNELNLRNKVSRGRFTSVFLMQCFMALGVKWIEMPESLAAATQPGAAQSLAKRNSHPLSDKGH
jgi:hypothetical protein